jgi:hypothetical protein
MHEFKRKSKRACMLSLFVVADLKCGDPNENVHITHLYLLPKEQRSRPKANRRRQSPKIEGAGRATAREGKRYHHSVVCDAVV